MLINKVILCEGIFAFVDQNDIIEIIANKDNKRVIVSLINDQLKPNRKIKDYFIWIDPEYAIKKGYTQLDNAAATKIALDVVMEQFNKNGKIIPIEDGMYLSNDEKIIINPKVFTHPLKKYE